MLTIFLEYVCLRGNVMRLCLAFKTWIETFAHSDAAKKCCKKTYKSGHGRQSVRYNHLKGGPTSCIASKNDIIIVTVEWHKWKCISNIYEQNWQMFVPVNRQSQ